jgi:hypothetical protein
MSESVAIPVEDRLDEPFVRDVGGRLLDSHAIRSYYRRRPKFPPHTGEFFQPGERRGPWWHIGAGS